MGSDRTRMGEQHRSTVGNSGSSSIEYSGQAGSVQPEGAANSVDSKSVGAKKFDGGKPPLSRLPQAGIEQVAHVLAFGAEKYGWENWKKGMNWTRLIDASLRHMYKFANKKDLDEESGLNHVAHAACNMLFLLYYYEHEIGTDDRSE